VPPMEVPIQRSLFFQKASLLVCTFLGDAFLDAVRARSIGGRRPPRLPPAIPPFGEEVSPFLYTFTVFFPLPFPLGAILLSRLGRPPLGFLHGPKFRAYRGKVLLFFE